MSSSAPAAPRPNVLAALSRARFVVAAHRLDQLPADQGREVAFAGRSNAGKSSALNAIAHQSALARTSKTPGRTQQLVVFEIDAERRLVDLPGYGYAKVDVSLREHWGRTLEQYFASRHTLCGLVVAMDIRHPLGEYDAMMLSLAASRGLPVQVLLTKADKLSRSQQGKTLREVRGALSEQGSRAQVQTFSAPEKQGVDEARTVLAQWLDLEPPVPTERGAVRRAPQRPT